MAHMKKRRKHIELCCECVYFSYHSKTNWMEKMCRLKAHFLLLPHSHPARKWLRRIPNILARQCDSAFCCGWGRDPKGLIPPSGQSPSGRMGPGSSLDTRVPPNPVGRKKLKLIWEACTTTCRGPATFPTLQ